MAETTIFPFLDPQAVTTPRPKLPVAREVQWDFVRDRPVFRGGAPVIVERAEAVAVWAWNALHTARWRWPLYTPQYGSELDSLIGQTWSEDYKRAEVRRYVTECLRASPYVKRLDDLTVTFADARLTVQFKLVSIYGMVNMEVVLDHV